MTAVITATGLARYGLDCGPQLTADCGDILVVTGDAPTTAELLWALAGHVHPDGVTVALGDSARRSRQHRPSAVLIPQGNALAMILTASENILVPLLAAGVRPEAAREVTSRLLGQLGLGESGDHLVEELSGGQQQRLAVARALSLRPAVIVADEPTSDLDATNRGVVIDLLTHYAADGGVVVIASTDPDVLAIPDARLIDAAPAGPDGHDGHDGADL